MPKFEIGEIVIHVPKKSFTPPEDIDLLSRAGEEVEIIEILSPSEFPYHYGIRFSDGLECDVNSSELRKKPPEESSWAREWFEKNIKIGELA